MNLSQGFWWGLAGWFLYAAVILGMGKALWGGV